MPGINGFEVCKQLRSWTTVPIIVLSVRDSEEDKIQALDMGADDFLTKPFGLRELLARMRAVLRRATAEEGDDATFVCDQLTIDFAHRLVYINNCPVHVTPKGSDLLSYMVHNPNRVLTHRQLLSKVWGPEYAEDTHTLRVHVANLRDKIEEQPERPRYIQTETRVGYRFRTDKDI